MRGVHVTGCLPTIDGGETVANTSRNRRRNEQQQDLMTKPLLVILLLLLTACDLRETLTEFLDESLDELDGTGLVCERLNLPCDHRDPWVDYSRDGSRFIDG